MKTDAISELLRMAVEQPYYLADDERLEVRLSTASGMLEETADEVRIWGAVIKRDTYDVVRESGVTIDGRYLRRALAGGSKGAFVDLVCSKLDELYELLEPEPLPDDLMQLAMTAFGSDDACDVLVDALLERGAVQLLRRTIGRRADTRTDDEKRADARDDLRRKAKAWARPFIEILFRRNWSVKPWAFYMNDTAPGTMFGINREPTVRLRGVGVHRSYTDDELRNYINESIRRIG